MNCKICGSDRVRVIYRDQIRDGGIGNYTKEPVTEWQCQECNVIWHENVIQDTGRYYESEEYRESLEGSSAEERFYCLHDKETLDKFQYTGTEIYRNKIVADIGCGCGGFLDFLKGVSGSVIAVEPSETYRRIMKRKGFEVYAYMEDAKKDYAGEVNIITSFDVIEHVEEPELFLKDIYELLSKGGKAVIGTPTDAPVMRRLLGRIYEKKVLFSTQHLWIFSERNLRFIAEKAGFSRIETKYYQRYGIGNMLSWIRDQEPQGKIEEEFITQTFDAVWKSQCNDYERSDYIVLYLTR